MAVGCKTGYRAGDNLSFRVQDRMQDGKIKIYVTVRSDKTNKLRTVWLNEAVRSMLEYTIKTKGLKPSNYIFRGDGNRKGDIDHFVYVEGYDYNDEGERTGVITTLEPYDEYGEVREVYDVVTVKLSKGRVPTGESKYNPDGTLKEIAPMLVGSVTRFLKQEVATELGIIGKFSSHTMRQTYSFFMASGWQDDRFAQAICSDFGHSSEKITLEHYMGISPQELREHQLGLNLGLEVVQNLKKNFVENDSAVYENFFDLDRH